MAGKYKRKARKASGNRSVVAVLRRARALVKRGWCQGHFAETADGRPCGRKADNAVKWCAFGAILAAGGGAAPGALRQVLPERSITSWNDTVGRTRAHVLRAFTKAIAKAEAAR